MPGFVKIYQTILDSSVWGEKHATRLVWITLLAMADYNGRVEASVGGLARRAQVSYAECREALAVLSSPDPDDKSGVDEGRRIQVVERGWIVTNHKYYRDHRSDAQIKTAERVRKHRSVVTGNASNIRNAVKRSVRADPDPDPNADQDPAEDLRRAGAREASAAAPELSKATDRDPEKPKRIVPPSSPAEALSIPVAVRAKAVLENPSAGQWSAPEAWPEVIAVAEALAKGAGQSRPRLGHMQRDAGVRAVLGLLADGWPPDRLVALAGAVGRSEWFRERKGGVKGLSSLTAEVLRRTENEMGAKPRGSGVDPETQREIAKMTAMIGGRHER